MSNENIKTTLYLDAEAYERIKDLARRQERPAAALVREAVAEYADRHAPRRAPSFVGAGRSERGDLSERVDELLAGFGDE